MVGKAVETVTRITARYHRELTASAERRAAGRFERP
jgi:hypothetical protein